MPLPSSGAITLNQIHTEVGGSSNSTASLSDPDIRQLIGAQQGDTISMGEFLGQAAPISVSIANDISNSVNKMNVASYLSSQGWNGVGAATLTIPSNVWVWSDSTGTAGMTISGSFPNGLTINNNGKIIGKGGDAGDNSNTTGGSANGSNGGNAINITSSSSITINNNSGAFIAGGGGGGAAADQLKNTSGQNLSGGAGSNVSGGGGGAGGGSGGAGTTFAAEPGGAINQTGDPVELSGTTYTTAAGAGGAGGSAGGGRQLHGVGGLFVAPFNNPSPSGIGSGGSNNSAGGIGGVATNASYPSGFITGGGGGGWGASGGSVAANQQGITGMFTAASGGAGGKAIEDNGNSFNFTNNGTAYGATT